MPTKGEGEGESGNIHLVLFSVFASLRSATAIRFAQDLRTTQSSQFKYDARVWHSIVIELYILIPQFSHLLAGQPESSALCCCCSSLVFVCVFSKR
jgi:hypothetical protein